MIGAEAVTPDDVTEVARQHRPAVLAPAAVEAINRSHQLATRLAQGDTPVYGLSTGFGALADRYIDPVGRVALQTSLVRSHAATAGDLVDAEVVRGMMLLRARTLASGYSGAKLAVVQGLLDLVNAGITPAVRQHGSLGCSGDLAPLAHVALVLIGEGEVVDGTGALVPAADALAAEGLAPLVLGAKEGLALTNGTDGIQAMLCLTCHDLRRLFRTAEVAAAMSVEALLGTDQAFLPELISLRSHPGQGASARNLMALLAGSEVVASHRHGDARVQDAYSLRCAPQVLGAARDSLDHACSVVARELSSAIDNPVVLTDGRVMSCGNFHGAPLGYVADFMAIAAADVGSMAERRTDRLLDPARSNGLPPFLAADPGVDSGLMLAQYTSAALVADCRRLAMPASVDNIPTSAMQEDHVSMAWAAAAKLRQAVANLVQVVAIELMTAARALELRPHRPAPATAAVMAGLRDHVPGFGPDRYMAPEIEGTSRLVASGEVLGWAESACGPLQ